MTRISRNARSVMAAPRRGLVLLFACLLLLGWADGAHAQEPVLGRGQRVAVVVCRYRESADPPLTAQDWAEALNERINAYFEQATRRAPDQSGMTTFRFVAVPGVCQFAYSYDETAPGGSASIFPAGTGSVSNDQQVRVREVVDAANYAASAAPTLFPETKRILVIVNRSKHAVGMVGLPLPFPFNLSYTLVDETDGTISDDDISTVAHELGHGLGLPDLYSYYGGSSPVAFWGLMGSHRQQHFLAQMRRFTGWLSGAQEVTIARPLIGQVQQTLRLHPPGHVGNTNGTEVIRLPFDPTGLLEIVGGYLIEARPLVGLDTPSGAVGLPTGYGGGVLVTKVNRFLSPDIAQPLIGIPVVEVQHNGAIEDAALAAGESFTDPDSSLTLEVLRANADDSFDVRVTWGEENWPDLQPVDLWIDHPDNGFGTFLMPNGGAFGDPLFFGDLPVARSTVTLIPPGITNTPVTHRLFVRVRNRGNVAAPDAAATVHVLEPVLPASFQPNDPASFLPLQISSRRLTLGTVPAGGSVRALLPLTLGGPVAVAVVVDQLEGEPSQNNNVYYELFPPGISITPGSPYPQTSRTYRLANANPFDHLLMPVVHDAPAGWTVSTQPRFLRLPENGESEVKITIQPPDPRVAKPGTFAALDAVNWIDTEHSMLPAARYPAYVLLNHRTRLVLTAANVTATSATVTARLTFFDLNGAEAAAPGETVALAVTGSDGSSATLYAKTDSSGRALFKVTMKEGTETGVVGQFVGTTERAPAVSGLHIFEPQKPPKVSRLYPSSVSATGKATTLYIIGSNFTPTARVLVNGTLQRTAYHRSTLLRITLSGSETAKPTTLKVAVRDGDRTSNAVALPVTATKIGVSEVDFGAARARPLQSQRVTITWTHPISGWRALDTLDLRLIDDGDVAAWVRFQEGKEGEADASTFSLLDPAGRVLGSGRAGEDVVLAGAGVRLLLAESSFAGSGPGDGNRGLTLQLALAPTAAVAGRTLSSEVYVTDDALQGQAPEIGPPLMVDSVLYLPRLQR